MLSFKANQLIRKPYEIARYGINRYKKIWHMNAYEKIKNPSERVFSPFPIAIDIVRSIQNRKKYADKISKKITSLLLVYKLVTSTKLSLYTLFVTTPNCTTDGHYHVIDKRNHARSPFTSYHQTMRNLRRNWKKSAPFLHDLANSIETTFGYRDAFNVHLHGLLGSTKHLTTTDKANLEAKASRQISRAMNNEAVIVHIRDFKDEYHNRKQSVTAYIHYMFKQYHLPVCKGMADYRSFMARPERERHVLVTSLADSTKGNRALTYSISRQSRFFKSLPVLHATVQTALFATEEDEPQSARASSHHYTSNEQWQRANRNQMKANHEVVEMGSKRLNKAILGEIHKIVRANKKATTIGSDGEDEYIQILSNIFKVTGIPP